MPRVDRQRARWVQWVVGVVAVPILAALIGAGGLGWFRDTSAPSKVAPTPTPSATAPNSPTPETSGVTASPHGGPSPRGSTSPRDNSALGRCSRGAPADERGTSILAGADGSATYPSPTATAPEPPNVIHPGDVIQVVGSGFIYVQATGERYGPRGNGTPASAGWFMPGVSEYSAIVRYNNYPTGWIGAAFPAGTLSACTRYAYNYDVRLFFYMNSPADHSGNSGAWSFEVKIYRDT